MPTQKIDPKVIFASDAPAIDKPPVFSDKTKGWDVSRANDGRPEIKQMNKIQQDTDLKILWLNENAVLPYDASIDYPDGAVTIKDGSFKQLVSGAWAEFLDNFANKDEVKRGIANRYDSSLTYNSGERVVLANGDIVKSTIDGNTNDPNVDMTGWELPQSHDVFDASGLSQQEINNGIESIAALRLLTPKGEGERVYLVSANLGQNEGGGVFVSTQKAGLLDNGGTIIQSSTVGIFYVRINLEYVTPEMFGAKGGTRAFDSHTALQAAFLSGYPVRLNSALYYVSKPLYHRNSFKLTGHGYWGKSQIFKTTSDVATLADVVCPNGVDAVSYAKDAVLIAYPYAGDFVHDVNIEGVLLGKFYESEVGDGYFMEGIVYFAPYIAQSSFKRMQLNACQYSFYSVNQWMCSFERVEGACYGGWVTGGLTGDVLRNCTTSSYTSCWSKNVFYKDAVAWSFYSASTISLNSCGTDGLGEVGAPATACIRAERSQLVINGFGLEVANTSAWIVAIDSVIKASNLSCYQYHNYTANGPTIFQAVRSQVKIELSTLDFMNTSVDSSCPLFVVAEDNSFVELENVRANPEIQGMNTGQPWDVRALSGSSIVIEADGTRSEYEHNDVSQQFPSRGGRNVTNRSIQSESTTQDFGLTAPLGGRIGNNYLRLGSARVFTNSAGRARYTVNNVPTGDFDGYRIGGVDVHSDNTNASALEGNMYYNKTTGRLRLFDGATWIEFAKVT